MVVVVLQGCHRRGRRLRRCRRRRGRFRCLTDVVAIAATVGVIVVVIVVVGVVGTGGTQHRTGDALVPAAESTAPIPSAGHSTRVRCAFREWEPTIHREGSGGVGWWLGVGSLPKVCPVRSGGSFPGCARENLDGGSSPGCTRGGPRRRGLPRDVPERNGGVARRAGSLPGGVRRTGDVSGMCLGPGSSGRELIREARQTNSKAIS